MKRLTLMLALACVGGARARASSSGIIAGTIKDEQGGVLPGVNVTLSGADRFGDLHDGIGWTLPLPQSATRDLFRVDGAPGLSAKSCANNSSCRSARTSI